VGSLGSVELDHDLVEVCQMPGQASAMATGPFDRPGPQHSVFAGELHQLDVALSRGFYGDLAEYATGARIDSGR